MTTPAKIELDAAKVLAASPSPRKLLYMVLLLAIKDKASEIRFEPDPAEEGCKLHYNVDGVRHDMVPPPYPTAALCKEILFLAGLDVTPCGDQSTMQVPLEVVIAGKATYVLAAVEPGSSGNPMVALSLHDAFGASGAAAEVLAAYLRESKDEEQTLPD